MENISLQNKSFAVPQQPTHFERCSFFTLNADRLCIQDGWQKWHFLWKWPQQPASGLKRRISLQHHHSTTTALPATTHKPVAEYKRFPSDQQWPRAHRLQASVIGALAIDFAATASNFSPDSFSPSQLAVTKSNLSVLFFISNGEHYFFCF